MASQFQVVIILLAILTSVSHISAIDTTSSTFTFSSSSSSPSPSSPPFPFSSSEALNQPQFLSNLTTITKILSDLGFHELATASHSLSLSSASHLPWLGPITIFAPVDSSVRACPSCSLALLLQEHTVSGLYPSDYLNRLIFGTKIETILPGRCLTVTSAANATAISISGAQITRPNLYIGDHVIIHGLQGFISHVSPYSCSMDKMTSLNLPHPSPAMALNRVMLAEAMIRLRVSGYSVLALAMRIKYAELVTLHNMTIFAVDDSTIFHGGHSYVHSIRFHVIPNQMLKLADLESLPVSTVFPTLESGETLTITTPGGGGVMSPVRINYIKIKYPNLIYNSKLVIHGLASPFPHLRQSIAVSTRRSGSSVGDSTSVDVRQSTEPAAPSPVMKSVVEMIDDIHQGL
ncbi:fasciclin-like arabinogalactan protein 21 [Chenopodium quinoa]|uniref:fasciclin-like arabinogalactan protein 21 n=1 Tax=Chenopodium quinoa TaxID=63459 RepID=UPI000B784FED|nr:fasciclin-like arabinogalactan protein 21 [Chenopodium quinoa]